MAAPAKFLFDTDFAAPDHGRAPIITPSEMAERIAQAEAHAYRAGFDAAQREAKVEADRRMALALEQIGIAAMTVRKAWTASRTKWRPRRWMSPSPSHANYATNWWRGGR